MSCQPGRADRREDDFRKSQIFLWMVFQMPVRYTDFGGDTGSTPDRQEEDLLHPDYHRGTVLGGGFPGRSVPTEGKDDFHWKEPVWGERDAAGGMRPRAGGEGKASIWPLSPLRYDIMGPFCAIPFLECRHSIWSMKHMVQGTVRINGEAYSFDGGEGYLERTGKPLRAPERGEMLRTIRESAACRARYRFQKDGRTLLAFETDRASFEYEYRA